MSARRADFEFGSLRVAPGRRDVGQLPVPPLVTGAHTSLPVRITHGREDGPTIWVSAAVHGDEILGVEIIRRVDALLDPREVRGTIITVPIVNVPGFLGGDRYLPDRRDLNRSFPGSPNGSLAARVAHSFMTEIVARCSLGIDLHTGSADRTNLPQIRGDLDDPPTRALARAFGAPVMLHSGIRDGSMRAAATEAGITILLYEAGEAGRFDETAIEVGTAGVLRVLAHEGLIEAGSAPEAVAPIESRSSTWVRARRSGIALLSVSLGQRVTRGEHIAVIHDSLGARLGRVTAPSDGIIVGLTQHPLVHQGDALVHIARTDAALEGGSMTVPAGA